MARSVTGRSRSCLARSSVASSRSCRLRAAKNNAALSGGLIRLITFVGAAIAELLGEARRGQGPLAADHFARCQDRRRKLQKDSVSLLARSKQRRRSHSFHPVSASYRSI